MKMVTAYVGSSALVRLTGRLDGEWSRHLADTLDELLRDGLRSVVLDMSQVDYISTPGVQVLGQRYRDFSLLRGELRVASPSPAVLQALTDAGLLDQLLLLPGDERVAGGAGRPSALIARPASEFTGDCLARSVRHRPGRPVRDLAAPPRRGAGVPRGGPAGRAHGRTTRGGLPDHLLHVEHVRTRHRRHRADIR